MVNKLGKKLLGGIKMDVGKCTKNKTDTTKQGGEQESEPDQEIDILGWIKENTTPDTWKFVLIYLLVSILVATLGYWLGYVYGFRISEQIYLEEINKCLLFK
jgi:hypothetical protein